MPVPKPREGEASKDFIGRCAKHMAKVDADRPPKQRLAMCYTSLRKVRGKSKLERIIS